MEENKVANRGEGNILEKETVLSVETFNKLSLLYQENAKVAAVFWEWRNKILTFFSTIIGAVFLLASWLYQQPNFNKQITSAVFFLGAVFVFISLRLDSRNKDILKNCYKVGKNIENKLFKNEPDLEELGIFNLIGKAHENEKLYEPKLTTYSEVLKYTSWVVILLFLGIAIYNLFYPLK